MFRRHKAGATRIKDPDAGSERDESMAESVFYVFTVRGYAIDRPADDATIREWAAELQRRYDERTNGERMKLQLVSPDVWRANAEIEHHGGTVKVHYGIDDYTDKIKQYLKTLRIPEQSIDRGIGLSRENKSQLMNPGGGIYLIGIPIAG
jgi:hypothetical protein